MYYVTLQLGPNFHRHLLLVSMNRNETCMNRVFVLYVSSINIIEYVKRIVLAYARSTSQP